MRTIIVTLGTSLIGNAKRAGMEGDCKDTLRSVSKQISCTKPAPRPTR